MSNLDITRRGALGAAFGIATISLHLKWSQSTVHSRQTILFNTMRRVVSDPDCPAREFWST